jgi:nitrite reductase/ring-hydroxylating ferredoxin subunit
VPAGPAWHRAVPLAALPARAAVRADCGGVPVCLALAHGQPAAVADACAHRATALSGGLVRDGILTCPGHFWRYDLRTGRCLHGPDAVPSYPCRIVAGWVEVLVPGPEPQLPLRQRLLAAARDRAARPEER